VQADSFGAAADELYALLPADFITARDERARQARSGGRRDEAAAIKKLARPTVSAWLVNQLVREAPAQMGRLFEVGESLHEAQRELAGERLRELSGQRRQVLAELLPVAGRLAAGAGQAMSTGVLDEVRATLEAAVADAHARAAVQSGRLAKSLTYAGLGEVDLTGALAAVPATSSRGHSQRAAPGRPGTGARSGADAGEPRGAEGGRTAAGRQSGQEAAEADAAADAAAAAEAAAAELAAADQQATSLAEQRQFLQRRIEHLKHELERASAEEADLAREARAADRARTAAARAADRAQRELAKARERAGSG
jgi:hypothetical protein